MDDASTDPTDSANSGKHQLKPRACIFDPKPRIRAFLSEALEELGFIVHECATPEELDAQFDAKAPDLVVLGFSAGGVGTTGVLEQIAAHTFKNPVLLVAPQHKASVSVVYGIGEHLELNMLPLLPTPFSDESLRDSLIELIPPAEVSNALVNVGDALAADWLEVWYQPKVDVQSLALTGAEALVRMRHPIWGVVLPSNFVPADDDPHFCAFSDFVTGHAAADWQEFLRRHAPTRMSVNLPISFFGQSDAVHRLTRKLPTHPAFRDFAVELDAQEILDHPSLCAEIAQELRRHNVSIAVDNVGTMLPSLLAMDTISFTEIKIDAAFINGCAEDRLKRAMCRQIVELAKSYRLRTVGMGVEAWADLLAARELGIDQAQGFLFAKPMPAQRFARDVLGRMSLGETKANLG